MIIAIHGNKIVDRPLMNSMAIGGCKNANDVHSKGKYRKPIIIIIPILAHRDGN